MRAAAPDPAKLTACLVALAHTYGDIAVAEAARHMAYPPIETPGQLAALPTGAIVESAAGTVAARYDTRYGVVFGDERPFPWTDLELPVRVLRKPAPIKTPLRQRRKR